MENKQNPNLIFSKSLGVVVTEKQNNYSKIKPEKTNNANQIKIVNGGKNNDLQEYFSIQLNMLNNKNLNLTNEISELKQAYNSEFQLFQREIQLKNKEIETLNMNISRLSTKKEVSNIDSLELFKLEALESKKICERLIYENENFKNEIISLRNEIKILDDVIALKEQNESNLINENPFVVLYLSLIIKSDFYAF